MVSRVGEIILDAAQRHGVNPNVLSTIAHLESRGNPSEKNPKSSAGGLFQFIDSTAKAVGLEDRFDPVQASDAAARLTKSNAQVLSRTLGRSPSVGELYLAHQQGAGGASRLLSNPNSRASDIVGAEAVRLNGGTPDMTAGEFANLWVSKADRIAGGAGDAGLLGSEATPQGGRDTMANGGILGGLLGGGQQGGLHAEGGLLGEGGFLSPDRRDRLILALQGMTLNPNQGLQQAALQGIQSRQQERQTAAQRNQTAEFLRQRGRDDLAGAVESGAIPAQAAVQEALRPPSAPETRVVEGRLVNAQTGDVIADFSSSGNVTQITGRDLIDRHGVDPTQIDPNSLFNVSPDGKVTQISGGGVEVNVGGERETAFQKEVGKVLGQQATSIIEQGAAASRNLVELRALEATLDAAPQGAAGQITGLAGRLGLPVEGVSDVQAAEAIISRLVPQQRPPGSGTMSDADLALFRQSLPQIANQPGGNKRIIETMRDIAEYDVNRAQIAQRLISGEISQEQAFSEYAKLSNPLGWVREGFKPTQSGGEQQQAGQAQQQGRATHRFNPETGQIEAIR